jgi:energy-coupling factor transporter ATP-binding protein EcfA2
MGKLNKIENINLIQQNLSEVLNKLILQTSQNPSGKGTLYNTVTGVNSQSQGAGGNLYLLESIVVDVAFNPSNTNDIYLKIFNTPTLTGEPKFIIKIPTTQTESKFIQLNAVLTNGYTICADTNQFVHGGGIGTNKLDYSITISIL